MGEHIMMAKSILAKLLLITFSIVSMTLIAEFLLYLLLPFKINYKNPQVFWDHWARPSSQETQELSNAYNSTYIYNEKLGYISKQAIPRDNNKNLNTNYRVMLLGDSIMQSREFSQPIISALKNKNPGVSLSFFNAGVGGWDTQQEALYLETYGLKYKPDLVILQFCMNDFSSSPIFIRMRDGQFAAFNAGKLGKYLNNSPLSQSQIFQRLLFSYLNWRPFDYNFDWSKVHKSMQKISNLSQSKNFRIHVVLIPYLRPVKKSDLLRAKKIRKIVLESFNTDQVSDFLDLQKSTEILNWRLNKQDYTHPNSLFSSFVAEEIANIIRIEKN